MPFRTDTHRNPTAFTTDIAKEAGLVEGVDYDRGAPFLAGGITLYTAELLKDPIETTVKVINAVGFFNKAGHQRWVYIAIPYEIWKASSLGVKMWIIRWMYQHEGGVIMMSLFTPGATAPTTVS